jgi:hypothetical protein
MNYQLVRVFAIMSTLFPVALSQPGLSTGILQIRPVYLGQPLEFANAAYHFSVYLDGNVSGSLIEDRKGEQAAPSSLVLFGIPVGTHTVQLSSQQGGLFGNPQAATVTQGNVTLIDLEISGSVGIVKGTLAVNGHPPPSYLRYAIQTDVSTLHYFLDNVGGFRSLVRAGSSNGSVYQDGPGPVQTFSYTAPAGQETNVGTINFAAGDLLVRPVYRGQPLSQTNAAFLFRVYLDGQLRGGLNDYRDGFPVENVVPFLGIAAGTHTVQLQSDRGGQVGPQIVTVSAGGITTADIDVTPFYGIIKGTFLVNGVPPPSDSQLKLMADVSVMHHFINGSGLFRSLVRAGSHKATVTLSGIDVLKEFPYTATSGVETDLGTLNYSAGNLNVRPLFNGQTLDQTHTAYHLYLFLDGQFAGSINDYNQGAGLPSFFFQGLASGSHTVQLGSSLDGLIGAPQTVTVTQGATTVTNIELSSLFGIIKGTLAINGVPPVEGNQYAIRTDNSVYYYLQPNNGQFRNLVRPGSRNAGVHLEGTGVVKYFPYTAVAGQEVIVSNPLAMNVLASVGAKSGDVNARVWQLNLRNLDSSPVTPSVTAFSLVQTSATACTPIVTTARPVPYSAIAPGATGSANFVINFGTCSATARFRLDGIASNGVSTQSFSIPNQFR